LSTESVDNRVNNVGPRHASSRHGLPIRRASRGATFSRRRAGRTGHHGVTERCDPRAVFLAASLARVSDSPARIPEHDEAARWIDRCVRHLLKLDPSIWPEHAAAAAAQSAACVPWRQVTPEAIAVRLYRAL
jgi:hypothetical protein